MHTGENVALSLPILARAGLLGAGRVACIGLFCTGRRYAMTLHRHWPGPARRRVHRRLVVTPARSAAGGSLPQVARTGLFRKHASRGNRSARGAGVPGCRASAGSAT